VNGEPLNLEISIGVGGIHSSAVQRARLSKYDMNDFFIQSRNMMIAPGDGLMFRAKNESSDHIFVGRPMSWSSMPGIHR